MKAATEDGMNGAKADMTGAFQTQYELLARIAEHCAASGFDVQMDIYIDITERTIDLSLGDLRECERCLRSLPVLIRGYLKDAMTGNGMFAQIHICEVETMVWSRMDFLYSLRNLGIRNARLLQYVTLSKGRYIEIGFISPAMHPHA